ALSSARVKAILVLYFYFRFIPFTRFVGHSQPFLTKNHKASIEDIQAAVDGKICAAQAEKLRIIRSHMSSLKLCKLNLESLILSVAGKYLLQLNLVLTVPGIKSFSAINPNVVAT
ncbi:MAG: hypothetical protein LIO58_06350, partial [Oscillospiraceae bacterium]|nr:hypothetical protein [Oscillospiraceae bacterium]